MNTEKQVVAFEVDADVALELRVMAAKNDESRSAWIRRAVLAEYHRQKLLDATHAQTAEALKQV